VGSSLNKEDNVLPALIMNLSVCFAVVATTSHSIKYLFWFFIIFQLYYIYIAYKGVK